ncbi:MAG: thioredoxin domain-containing protein [Betaproteobacteria bacterium]|nr:thioredoxin domain-containing protein [Betaproteobacteria bacterium]
MNRKALFAGAVVALAAAFVVATLVYRSEQAGESAQVAASNQASLVRFHAPTLGNPEAKVHIVEFIDPACETCAAMYPHVKRILVTNPDRVRLSMRHVPFHRGADYVAKVLEAARKQGKYWETLDVLMARQPQWVANHTVQTDHVLPLLGGVGLDLARLQADMEAPDVAQRIALDMADAKALNVTKTPEYFVNGRPLPSFGLEQLQGLVGAELASAYR